MIVPGISQTLRLLGKQSYGLRKTLYLDCKTHENINDWSKFIFFGKWPLHKRDNALRGVRYQELIEFAEATASINSW